MLFFNAIFHSFFLDSWLLVLTSEHKPLKLKLVNTKANPIERMSAIPT